MEPRWPSWRARGLSLRPRRYDSIRSRVRNGLAEMLVHVRHQLEHHAPSWNRATVQARGAVDLRLRQSLHATPRKLRGLAQQANDGGLAAQRLERVETHASG